MIGLDTNVLVRYVMQDDAKQSPIATRLIEDLTPDSPGFVPVVTLVELVWVLSSAYGLSREQIATTMDVLLRSKELVIDQAQTVLAALRSFQAGRADFADCLIVRTAQGAGCDVTMTFDLAATRSAGMTLLS